MNGAASSRSPAALLRRGPLAARAQQPAMPGFLNAVHPPEWVALNNINETGNRRWAGSSRGGRRSQAKLWVAVGIAIAVVATASLAYSYRQSDAARRFQRRRSRRRRRCRPRVRGRTGTG